MKSAIVCFKCGMFKKYSETYAVKVVDYQSPVILDSSKNQYQFPARKVRVCRTCIKRMGYKVKGGKKNVGKK